MNPDHQIDPRDDAERRIDADLRARVRRADPAGVPPVVTADSLEAVMSEIQTTPAESPAGPAHQSGDGAVAPARRPKRRLALLAVAASVAVAAAGYGVGSLLRPDAPATPAFSLTVPTDGGVASGMCMAISPEMFTGVPLAFDGVVTSLEGGVATLEVTKWYRGGDPSNPIVAVTVPDPDLVALIGAPTFKMGGRYLISSDGSQIGLCGASDAYSPQLAAIYAQAFPG